MNSSQPDLVNLCSQWYWFVNALVIVIFIPAADQLVFPCLRDRVPSMLKRIGLSLVILFVSVCILMIYEENGARGPTGGSGSFRGDTANISNLTCTLATFSPAPRIAIDYKLVIIPLILISIAEVLLMVSGIDWTIRVTYMYDVIVHPPFHAGLEFFYAQSPSHMRGMAVGFFFFVNGFFGTFAAVILHIFQQRVEFLHCARWYYVTELLLATVVFALFVCTTVWYKYRKRTGLEDSGQFYRF